MRAVEFITSLKQGELKKLALKGSDTDILSFINAGIVDLHKRFPLRRESVAVTPVAGIRDYSFSEDGDLNVDFDTSESQLIMIEEVSTTDVDGVDHKFIPSNSTKPQNFSTPTYNVLRIHPDYLSHTIEVEVRLAPLPIVKVSEDIPLPPHLMDLLSLYVGYKAHNSVSADIKGENNSYYVRYISEIQDMKAGGQVPLDPLDYSMLEVRGFI